MIYITVDTHRDFTRLDKIEKSIKYDKWYCGHYHTEKKIDNLEFMFESIKEF